MLNENTGIKTPIVAQHYAGKFEIGVLIQPSMHQTLIREDFEMSSGLIRLNFTLKDLKWSAQGHAASK